MPDLKVDRFKAKFGYISNDLFNVRYEKVKAALSEANHAWEHLREVAPSGVAGPLEKPLLDLAREMSSAKDSVDRDSGSNSVRKQAYKDLESVKAESRKLAKEITLVAKKIPTKCTLEDGTETAIYPTDIPGFFKMTEEERGEVIVELGKKISRGKEKVNEILSGEYSGFPPPDREITADIMWFLKSTAEAKCGEAYERGALTLPDPGNRLRKFFDRVGEVYTRDSSHLAKQQEKDGGQARGIDFYDGVGEDGSISDLKKLLPSGMRTVLLQQVKNPSDEPMLYVKMETESARWNPFHKKQDGAPDNRPLQPGDRKNAILHLGNLIKSKLGLSQGDDESLRGFREKVSSNIKNAWKAVIEAAKSNAEAKKILKKAKFINEMSEAILKVFGLDSLEDDADVFKNFEIAASDWHEVVMKEMPKDTAKDIEDLFSRFGGEVVLNSSDLEEQPVTPSIPSGFKFFKQGSDGLCAYYALCHHGNTDIGKQNFLDKGKEYYLGLDMGVSEETALEMSNDGNDPTLLTGKFGFSKVAITSKDVHILADVGAGHFIAVRKVDDVWWKYDSLNSGPSFIGDDNAVTGFAKGKLVYGK